MVADKRAFSQILINLISNAIRFTDRGGKIAVGARADGGQVTFMVEDNGVGIDEQDLARVGEPYFQARATLRSSPQRNRARTVDRQRAGAAAGGDLDIEPRRQGHPCTRPAANRLRTCPHQDAADGDTDRACQSRRAVATKKCHSPALAGGSAGSRQQDGEETCVSAEPGNRRSSGGGVATAALAAVGLRLWSRVAQRPVDVGALVCTAAASLIIVVNAVFLQSGVHPAPFFANPTVPAFTNRAGGSAAGPPAAGPAAPASPAGAIDMRRRGRPRAGARRPRPPRAATIRSAT